MLKILKLRCGERLCFQISRLGERWESGGGGGEGKRGMEGEGERDQIDSGRNYAEGMGKVVNFSATFNMTYKHYC